MKRIIKKRYIKPSILKVEIDREIILLQPSVSEGDPPVQPGAASIDSETSTNSTTQESLKESNFEDNPFER